MEIDIGADTYTVYADEDTADTYAAAAYHAEEFRNATLLDRQMALVTATRLLDRQLWRDGYTTFAERAVVQNIIDASIEIAIDIINGSDMQNQSTNATLERSISAGSVSITNFRGVQNYTRFPTIVQELLRDYLTGNGSLFMPKSTGVADETIFPLGLGYSSGGM